MTREYKNICEISSAQAKIFRMTSMALTIIDYN